MNTLILSAFGALKLIRMLTYVIQEYSMWRKKLEIDQTIITHMYRWVNELKDVPEV